MYDRYVIAKVIKQNKNTLHVQYWKQHRNEWNDETNLRRLTRPTVVEGVLGDLDMKPEDLNLAYQRIQSAEAQFTQSKNQALATYMKTVRELCQ